MYTYKVYTIISKLVIIQDFLPVVIDDISLRSVDTSVLKHRS